MADTVRIYWSQDEADLSPFMDRPVPRWNAWVQVGATQTYLFGHTDRDEFLRRYNALRVIKEPALEKEG